MQMVTDGLAGGVKIVTQTVSQGFVKVESGRMDDIQIGEWWVDNDGTRYSLRVIATNDQMLLLVGHGTKKGNWFALENVPGSTLVWSYLAEKLGLREGDRPGWEMLFSAVLWNRYRTQQDMDEEFDPMPGIDEYRGGEVQP